MKLKQEAKLTQRLVLTPSTQASLNLLQMPLLKLHLEVAALIEKNPFLEKSELLEQNVLKITPEGQLTIDQYNSTKFNISKKEHDMFSFKEQSVSLRDYLLEQIYLQTVTDRIITKALIDSLNENGYLADPLEELLPLIQKEIPVTLEQLEEGLTYIQTLDPPGIGARNLSESLAIQLRRKEKVPFITKKHALLIVEHHLHLFERHNFSRIKKELHIDDEDLAEAIHLIQTCVPNPGSIFSTGPLQIIIPELIAFKKERTWHVRLNPEALPTIRITSLYSEYLNNKPEDPIIKSHFLEAYSLIRHLYQRFETILRTGKAIVALQQNYFEQGPLFLRPLVLREIADTLELHESTISRTTTQKYIQTPYGIVELKYFFTRAVQKTTGDNISVTAIREHIKQIIGEENKRKPLSDEKIAQMLRNQGIPIARRTVAKYREILRILPTFMRKSI